MVDVHENLAHTGGLGEGFLRNKYIVEICLWFNRVLVIIGLYCLVLKYGDSV
jgi:hypothetical protein